MISSFQDVAYPLCYEGLFGGDVMLSVTSPFSDSGCVSSSFRTNFHGNIFLHNFLNRILMGTLLGSEKCRIPTQITKRINAIKVKLIQVARNFPISNLNPIIGCHDICSQFCPVEFKAKLTTGIIRFSEMDFATLFNAAPRMNATTKSIIWPLKTSCL